MSSASVGRESTHSVEQSVITLDRGQSASIGSGIQNVYYGEAKPIIKPSYVTITPPWGRLPEDTPLRGREDLLAEIERAVVSQAKTNGVHVIHGLAGSGKTSVALRLASKVAAKGASVWWIAGNDKSSLAMGMRTLAANIGLSDDFLSGGDPADLVWRKLSTMQGAWLLIIDNVDDPSVLDGTSGRFVDGTGWVRPDVPENGTVLITSRESARSIWGSWCTLHHTANLNSQDGASMLLDYVDSSLGSLEDAKKLVTELGGLPLAIRLAGLYLASTSQNPWQDAASIIDFSSYIAALEQDTIPDAESKDKFTRAWDLSIALLERRGFAHARSLLEVLASYGDSNVPFKILLEPAVISETDPFKGVSARALWDTVLALSGLGMVSLVRSAQNVRTPDLLNLHPLVRRVTRANGVSESTHDDAAGLALHLIHRAIVDDRVGYSKDVKNWVVWEQIAPHIKVMVATFEKEETLSEGQIDALYRITTAAVDYLAARGLQLDAELLARRLLSLCVGLYGERSVEAVAAAQELSSVLELAYKYEEALALRQMAVKVARDEFGPGSQMSLAALYNLAGLYTELGELEKAESLLRKVLDAEGLDSSDADALKTKEALGRTLRLARKYDEALVFYSDVVTARTASLGRNSMATMYARHHLAHTLSDMGRHLDAETYHRELIADYVATHGADNPVTLNGRHCLSHLLNKTGAFDEAVIEVTAALEGRIRVYGEKHPGTLELRGCLATLYRGATQAKHARTELETVVRLFTEELYAEHGLTLRARHDLVHALADSGDLLAAQREAGAVYATQNRLLGAKHNDTRQTKACLDRLKTRAAATPGAFPVHGVGKSSKRKQAKRKKRR